MPGRELRKFQRIPCDHRAVLEVGRTRERAAVTVRTLSFGGVGVTFDEWDAQVMEAGADVVIHVALGPVELDLPGHVAWCDPSHYRRFDLGIVLDLQRAHPAMRDAYLGWVRSAL